MNAPHEAPVAARTIAFRLNGVDATAAPGESFYSADGASWTDLTEDFAEANFCIKVLSTPGMSRSGGSGGCSAASASPLLFALLAPLLLLRRR